jgi:hypothetical protein
VGFQTVRDAAAPFGRRAIWGFDSSGRGPCRPPRLRGSLVQRSFLVPLGGGTIPPPGVWRLVLFVLSMVLPRLGGFALSGRKGCPR